MDFEDKQIKRMLMGILVLFVFSMTISGVSSVTKMLKKIEPTPSPTVSEATPTPTPTPSPTPSPSPVSGTGTSQSQNANKSALSETDLTGLSSISKTLITQFGGNAETRIITVSEVQLAQFVVMAKGGFFGTSLKSVEQNQLSTTMKLQFGENPILYVGDFKLENGVAVAPVKIYRAGESSAVGEWQLQVQKDETVPMGYEWAVM